MNARSDIHRSALKDITHRAMLEQGFPPDYSPEAIAELNRIQGPGHESQLPFLAGVA